MPNLKTGYPFARTAIVCGALLALLAAASASAATISISFTGLDLVYDGSALYDAGSTSGGFANPAEADPLTSVSFSLDGSLLGTLSSDISVDAFIPGVTGISASAGAIDAKATGTPGFFDVLIGTSPVASQFLLVEFGEATITYVDVANTVQFTFGAAISNASFANLPFGLQPGNEVAVSFSAQIVPGTRTDDGVNVTGFAAVGTGEYLATQIPEPATALLAAAACLAIPFCRRR